MVPSDLRLHCTVLWTWKGAGRAGAASWAAHNHHAVACGDDAAECRADHAPLEHGRLRAQDLGDGLAGPAATGQFGIEFRKAAGCDRAAMRAQVSAAPEGLLDFRRQFARLGAPGARVRWVSEALGR